MLRALKSHLTGGTRKRKQTMTGFGTISRATTALFTLGKDGKKREGDEDSQVSGDTLSTDGIDLTVEPLPLSEAALALASSKERTKPKVPLSFSVWDFGGTSFCGRLPNSSFLLLLSRFKPPQAGLLLRPSDTIDAGEPLSFYKSL